MRALYHLIPCLSTLILGTIVDRLVRQRRVIPVSLERPYELGHVLTIGNVEEVAHLRPDETTRHMSTPYRMSYVPAIIAP